MKINLSKSIMKLFQINVVANSASTGRIVEDIATTMISKGWDCYTAYGRWANPSKSILYRIGNCIEIYYHYFLSRIFGKHGLGSVRATKRLIDEMKKVNPDIIHLHNIHGYYLNYPLLFEYLSTIDTPVIWTLHDCWAFTGHCVHYTDVKCDKWKSGCFDCPNLCDYPKSWMDNSSRNYKLKKEYFTKVKNMTIVSVSQWLGNEVKHSFLSKYSVKTIHNGIDTSIFTPTASDARNRYGIGDRFLILGVATHWDKRKGLSDFIELSKRLSKDEVILLVGLSEKQISSLPSNIIGIQKTENILKLVELYSSADLFVNFSVEETFGMTTAESMACGIPVLVYNSTACPEIVTKETGFVIEPYDIAKAYEIIGRLKKQGKRFFRDACISYVRKNFKKEDKYQEYADLYDEILHKR